jgi:hypothetical protein
LLKSASKVSLRPSARLRSSRVCGGSGSVKRIMKDARSCKRGRETKLTSVVEAAIIANIQNCATQEAAATLAGISYRTLRNWIVWGEAGREPYFHFFQVLTRARVEVEYKLVDTCWKAAQRDWRAAMALLEKRFPETYGNRRRLEAVAPRSNPFQIEVVRKDKVSTD